jgi:hypothetical protein
MLRAIAGFLRNNGSPAPLGKNRSGANCLGQLWGEKLVARFNQFERI